MIGNRILDIAGKCVGGISILLLFGCVSTDQSAVPAGAMTTGSRSAEDRSEVSRDVGDFIGMFSAVILKVGEEVKAQGYKVIFTDVGPESLERDAPEVFRDLARRSSEGGVEVRGASRAVEKGGQFRDKKSGEKGVALWIVDFEEDGQGGYIVFGSWSDRPDQENSHEFKYLVMREGARWKAQTYKSTQRASSEGRALLPGVNFFPGNETLSGQLVFQRLDYERPNGEWKCLSNVVYSLDLRTERFAQLADLGALDARLVKVSDDGRMLCLYDIDGGVDTRFLVHSVEMNQTKEVKRLAGDRQPGGVAVLGNTVFVGYAYALFQYDFFSESCSEFCPAGLPIITSKWTPTHSYPWTRFDEPGVLYFTYFEDGTVGYYRWIQSSGELKKLPDFSSCMTAEGKHVRLGARNGNSYPLIISPVSEFPSKPFNGERDVATNAAVGKGTEPITIAKFKFPGGKSCRLDQLSPCGGFALLTVDSGVSGVFIPSRSHYMVALKDGHSRMLLHNEYATLRRDLGTVSRVFWVKKEL